jgi:hypothetical protein
MINTWSMHYGEKNKIPCKHNLKFSLVKSAKQCGAHLESADIQRLPANGILLVPFDVPKAKIEIFCASL